VGLFENGIVQVNSSVGTIASLVWNPENQSATTFGSLGSVPSTAVLKDVTIINAGSVTLYLNGSSQSASAANGLAVPAGGQVTVQGYSVSSPTGTTGQIWGQALSPGTTGATIAGLASVASVV
jgi:hypothetical protein